MSTSLLIDAVVSPCKIYLVHLEKVFDAEINNQRDVARDLSTKVQELLEHAALAPEDLTDVYCMVGPGSFTGIRAGLSFALGLGHGLNILVKGLNRLTVLRHFCHTSEACLVGIYGGKGHFYMGEFDGFNLKKASHISHEDLRDFLSQNRLPMFVEAGEGVQVLREQGGAPQSIQISREELPRLLPKISTTSPDPFYIKAPNVQPPQS